MAPACARASDHTRAHRHEHTRVGGGGTRALNRDEGCADTGRVSAHQEEKCISALAAEVRRSGSSHGAGLGQWARGRVEGGGWRVAGGVGGVAQQPQGKVQSLGGARGGTRHTPTRSGSRVLSSLYLSVFPSPAPCLLRALSVRSFIQLTVAGRSSDRTCCAWGPTTRQGRWAFWSSHRGAVRPAHGHRSPQLHGHGGGACVWMRVRMRTVSPGECWAWGRAWVVMETCLTYSLSQEANDRLKTSLEET